MKKYTSRATKWLIVVSLICGVVLLTGIILAFAGIGNIRLPIGLIMMGGLLGILFFCCFLAEKSRVSISRNEEKKALTASILPIFPEKMKKNTKVNKRP